MIPKETVGYKRRNIPRQKTQALKKGIMAKLAFFILWETGMGQG